MLNVCVDIKSMLIHTEILLQKVLEFKDAFFSFPVLLVAYGTKYGRHGYDNRLPSMQAVFMAHGPRFRTDVEIPSLQNIDLYHLFARLLDAEELVADLHIDGIDRQDIWEQMLKTV